MIVWPTSEEIKKYREEQSISLVKARHDLTMHAVKKTLKNAHCVEDFREVITFILDQL